MKHKMIAELEARIKQFKLYMQDRAVAHDLYFTDLSNCGREADLRRLREMERQLKALNA